MVLTRRKYGPQGSVFDTDTGQVVQKSQVGVSHVLQDGQYYPYIWDQQKRILKYYGDPLLEMHFTVQGIEFWQDGVKQFTGKFNFERNTGTWNKLTVAAGGLSITETEENEPTKQLEINYTLGGTEATGKISLKAGGFHKAFIGFELTALQAAELRMTFETDIDEVPEDILVPEEHDGPPLLLIGKKFTGTGWFHAWKKEEIADHVGEKIDGGYKLKMKEGTYAKDEKKSLFPTTIGPYQVSENADDGWIGGTSWGSAGPDSDGICSIGSGNTNYEWSFFRMQITDEIPTGATINAGTIIEIYSLGTWSVVSTDDIEYRATDSDNPSAPTTAGERPDVDGGSTPITTATVPWADVGTGGWPTGNYISSPSIATLIQELHDSYDLAANDYVVIWARGTNFPSDGYSFNAELNEYPSTSNTAKLTIVYTDAITLEQEGFRFRNDDGNETTATWDGSQDTDITQPQNTTRRIRFILNTSGNANAILPKLEGKPANAANWIGLS